MIFGHSNGLKILIINDCRRITNIYEVYQIFYCVKMAKNGSVPYSDSIHNNSDSREIDCRDTLAGCYTYFYVPAVVYYTFYGIASFLITAGNLLVIIAVLRNKKLRSSATNILIVSLAFSDLFIGIILCPYEVADMILLGIPLKNSHLCRLILMINRSSMSATTLSLLAIAADRFRAIVQPMRQRITVKQAKWMAVLIWFLSVAYNSNIAIYRIVTVTYFDGEQNISFVICDVPYYFNYLEYRWYVSNILVMYALPLMILCLLYGKMIFALYSGTSINDESRRRKRKAVKMLIIVVILYAIAWGPIRVFFVLYAYDESWFTESMFIYTIISFLFISNSFVNPVIYAFCNRNFRDEFILILSCGMIQPPSKTKRNISKITKSTEAGSSIVSATLTNNDTSRPMERENTVKDASFENQAFEKEPNKSTIQIGLNDIQDTSPNETLNGDLSGNNFSISNAEHGSSNNDQCTVSESTQTTLG